MFDIFHRREHRFVLLLEKSARFFLYAALLLIPLVYFPWTSEALEINKQAVLIFCSIFATLAWLGSFVSARAVQYKKTWLNVLISGLLLTVLISTIISLAPWTSLLGGSEQEYVSLISWVAMSLLFIAAINLFDKVEYIGRAVEVIVYSVGIVLLLGALSVFGIQVFSVNLIGAPNAMGFIAVMGLALALGLRFLKKDLKSLISTSAQMCTLPIILFSIIILYGLDYWLLWLFSAFVTALISAVKIKVGTAKLSLFSILLAALILVVSIMSALLPVFGERAFPVEVAPTYTSSYQIATDTLEGGSLLFGSGPGTFEIDYHQYKPASVNESDFWSLTFSRSGSHILTLAATIGVIGLILYLGIMLWIFLQAAHFTFQKKEGWALVFLLLVSWLVLAASQFLYSSNITILTVFWILGAALIALTIKQQRTIAFAKSQSVALVLLIAFIIYAIGAVVGGAVVISRYAADIHFSKAVASSNASENSDEIIAGLVRATELNKWSDVYARNLSNALLIKSAELLADNEVSPESVQAYIANAIEYAAQAVAISPNVVENQAMLGDVYREVLPFVAGTDVFAVQAYQDAITLSPTNPIYRVSLGQAYIAQADMYDVMMTSDDDAVALEASLRKSEALSLAVEACESALDLKSDYAPALYYLSLAYERQGNLTEAISGLAALQAVSPYDSGLAFQIGILYLQQGKFALAQEALEYTISLSPGYSNAHWFLSSVYEQQGDIEGAILEVEIVLEINPENALVIQRLEGLQAGLIAEEDLEPIDETVEVE